jgi:nitrite reductase (NADH) small subunit
MERLSVATLASQTQTWVPVMASHRLRSDVGRCVLVDGKQIAIFRIADDNELFGLANVDPFSGAPVISRGIVGSSNGEPKVASPMYKQSFSLRTGICFDDPTVTLTTYVVREVDGFIEVCV